MLCKRCDQLRLDNLEKTHAVQTSNNGENFLDFGNIKGFADYFDDIAPTFPSLESSKKGCELCTILRSELAKSCLKEHQGKVRFSYRYQLQDEYIQGPKYPGALIVEAESDDSSLLKKGITYVFSLHGDQDCVREWLHTIPRPEKNALSAKSLKFINASLESPLPSEPAPDMNFVPTRLLDLGLGEDGDASIRLILTKKPVEYATLSYCWGPPEDAKEQSITTDENLNDRLKEIPFRELSAVIQDAVRFCRSVRKPIRYLWVDALCIIQRQGEGGQDWPAESAVMGQIYKNAEFTLCALGSSSCKQGFLSRELRSVTVNYRSPFKPNAEGTYTMVLMGKVELPKSIEMIDDGRCANLFQNLDIFTTLWLTRGWTFQEFHMTKRRIFIGRAGTHFSWNSDKNTATRSEDGTQTIGPGLVSFAIDRDEWSATLEKLGEFWHRVLYEYRQRDLTQDTDQLPALAGLAKWVARSSGVRYLAGIWDIPHMRTGLMWSCTLDGSEKDVDQERPSLSKLLLDLEENSFAPSWSPLSLRDGRNDFPPESFAIPLHDGEDKFKLCNVDMVVEEKKNPFRMVESLTLDGLYMSLAGTTFERGGSSNDRTKRWNIRSEANKAYVAHALLDFTPVKENGNTIKLSAY
ncbi:hypothetical protein N0V84_004176 [Fusarium piperis]|uniref:Heterokaryon incompatibility domain-containing protein n=1 Tax=Fusarium piperis TaxID=1435070 RepID=A0A9W9BQ48_9HYPO|nr:hypothetical protein N0V84_004176 [Fusarium piperis]